MKKLIYILAASAASYLSWTPAIAQPLDFSSAYVKKSGTNIDKITLDGVRWQGKPTLLEIEYIPGINYSLQVGPGTKLSPSPLSTIETAIRNRIFTGQYTGSTGLQYSTSLSISIAQDGFVAGEISHVGNSYAGLYRGRVAGYLKPITNPNPTPQPPEYPQCPPPGQVPNPGPVLSISSAEEISALSTSHDPCKEIIIKPTPEGPILSATPFSAVVTNTEAESNDILSKAGAGSAVISGWRLYLKRLDALQYANGSNNGWSSNREYILLLSKDGQYISGSVSIPQDALGGNNTNPQTGSIKLNRK